MVVYLMLLRGWCPARRWLPGALQEGGFIEVDVLLEHVVDRASDLMTEDAEGLALAVALRQALNVSLHSLRLAQKQQCYLGEGPLEMAVADLLVRGHAAK